MCKPLITHRHLPQIAEKVHSTTTEQERRQILYEQKGLFHCSPVSKKIWRRLCM